MNCVLAARPFNNQGFVGFSAKIQKKPEGCENIQKSPHYFAGWVLAHVLLPLIGVILATKNSEAPNLYTACSSELFEFRPWLAHMATSSPES